MTRYLTISPTSIITYLLNDKEKTQQGKSHQSRSNLTKKYTSEFMTKTAARKVKKILTNWIIAINLSQQIDLKKRRTKRRYLVMITLTLSWKQVEKDNEVKRKYLNNFIIQLKKKHKGILYLWVAEKQKNGNIHFHVMVDRWVDKIWAANTWNTIQNTGNYIDFFEREFNHRNPPSTKLTGQKGMSNPAEYLTKYVTKSEKSHGLTGHKWSCSDELKFITNSKMPVKSWYHDFLEHYRKELKCEYFETEFVKIYSFRGNFLEDFIHSDLFYDNEQQYLKIYGKIYPELLPATPLKPSPTAVVKEVYVQKSLFATDHLKTSIHSASML